MLLTMGSLPNALWKGWLPATIGNSNLVVRWIEVGSSPLSDPFFQHTIAALRREQPPAKEFETEIRALAAVTAHFPVIAPAGIVMHMSRCGSTLVLNALRMAEGVVGVSEAQPVSLLMHLAASRSEARAMLGRDLLNSIGTVFSHYRGTSRPVIFKCLPGDIRCLDAIHSLWPEVPCLILLRNPIEVITSNLWTPTPTPWFGGFPRPSDSRDTSMVPFTCFGQPPNDVISAGTEGLLAWVLGRYCDEGLRQVNARCRVLDYEDVGPLAVREIAHWFGVDIPIGAEQRLKEVFSMDAKSEGRGKPPNHGVGVGVHKFEVMTSIGLRRKYEARDLRPE